MKKRLSLALAAGALVAAMLPGVASAAPEQTVCRSMLPGGASNFAVNVPIPVGVRPRWRSWESQGGLRRVTCLIDHELRGPSREGWAFFVPAGQPS
jgi:hypothetical protein